MTSPTLGSVVAEGLGLGGAAQPIKKATSATVSGSSIVFIGFIVYISAVPWCGGLGKVREGLAGMADTLRLN